MTERTICKGKSTVKQTDPEIRFQESKLLHHILVPSGSHSLVTMVFQDLITSYKEKKMIVWEAHLSNLNVYIFIEELATTGIFHPTSSLKLYEDLTSVADPFTECKKENKQMRKQQELDIFSACSQPRKQKNHFSCAAVCHPPSTDLQIHTGGKTIPIQS